MLIKRVAKIASTMRRSFALLSFTFATVPPIQPEASPPASPTVPKQSIILTPPSPSVKLKQSTGQVKISNQQKDSSSSKKQLSPEAQRAIWAYKIILHILNAQDQFKDIRSFSLRQQIINLQLPDQVHQFQQTYKQEVLALFTTGIYLNTELFNEKRIENVRQAFQLDYKQQDKFSFIFCPNYLVTRKIFKAMTSSLRNYLITGGFGISKTVSIILYIHLSNYVNTFLYLAATDPQKKFELQSLKSLPELNYFKSLIPRVWFWSVNKTNLTDKKFFQQLMLIQAPQLSNETREKLQKISKLKKFIEQLKNCYPESIKTKVVVDQVDVIISHMRNWNFKNRKYSILPQKQQKRYKKEYAQDRELLKIPSLAFKDIFKQATLLATVMRGNYVLSSSMSVEKQFLEIKKDGDEDLSLQIYEMNRPQINILQIDYLLKVESASADYWHNFWFEIERKLVLLIQGIDREIIDQLKNMFYNEVQKKQTNYFSRFLYVRQYFNEPSKLNQVKEVYKLLADFKEKLEEYESKELTNTVLQCPQKPKFDSPFIAIIQQYNQFHIKSYGRKVSQFVRKAHIHKETKSIFYAIYDIAVQKLQKNVPGPLTITEAELKENLINIREPIYHLRDDNYKEILPCMLIQQKDKEKTLKFYWTPLQFLQASENALYYTNTKSVPMGLHQAKSYVRYSASKGIRFEHDIIQSLTTSSVLTLYHKNDLLPKLKFQIKHSTKFQPFNQSYPSNKKTVIRKKVDSSDGKDEEKVTQDYALFSKNLKEVIQSCRKFENKYIMAIPWHNEKFDDHSECIDFLIAKKTGSVYHLFTFDVTISEQSTKQDNAKAFFERLFSIQSNDMMPLKIHHIVLAPRKGCDQLPYDKDANVNILFCDWERMTIAGSRNIEAYESFLFLRERILDMQKNKGD